LLTREVHLHSRESRFLPAPAVEWRHTESKRLISSAGVFYSA
jgi:hypothetical protein